MSWILRIVLFFGVAPCLAGCAGQGEPAPVLIGHVAAQPEREGGGPAVRGIRLAVVEANKSPDQAAGRPVKVIHTDTLGKLEAFEAEAVRLARVNRVTALLGGTIPEEVERLDAAGLPVVSPCGIRPRSAGEGVFCIGLSPARHGTLLARFAATELKATRPLVLANEEHEGHALVAEAFARAFPAVAGKQEAGQARPRPRVVRYAKDADLAELAGRARAEKTDAVLLAGPAADLRRLRKELTDAPVSLLFGGTDGEVQAEELSGAGRVWLATAFTPEGKGSRIEEFVKQYREAFGEVPGVQAALAYEGARLLFEAIRRTKDNVTPDRVREELAQIKDFAGLAGPLSVGADGTFRRAAFVVRLADGRAHVARRYGPEE